LKSDPHSQEKLHSKTCLKAWRCCGEFGGMSKRPEIMLNFKTLVSGWLTFKTENLLRPDATLRNNPVR